MYFECSSGTGKGNNLIVTCASDFAGVTITCTNGEKTYFRVCPSSEPYEIEFSGLESGTWTISGTVEGTLYSTNVVIADYTATLDSGFDYKTWCTEGGVDATQYSSLADVFADELAVHRLMTVHASADYLIECVSGKLSVIDVFCANDTAMKWIGLRDYVCDGLTAINGVEAKFLASEYWERYLKDHVPVMTSNNAPYGVASAYQVFDGNASTSASGTDFAWKSPYPICVKKFESDIAGGTLQGSNDGINYTDIATPSANSEYYMYHRVHYASSVTAHEVQFYGRALNVSVPIMTSNTAPYGECNGNFEDVAYKAFDGATTTQGTSTITAQPKYLGYTFLSKVCVKAVEISEINNRTNYRPWHMQLKGSDDRFTTESLITSLVGSNNIVSELLTFNNSDAYKGFRLYVQDAYSGTSTTQASTNYCNFDCLQFYGVDYSEREFEPNSGKKWLYDHGLELETFTTSGAVTKGDDYLTLSAANSEVTTTVDLTNYSILRGSVGDHMSGTTQLSVGGSNPATATLTSANAPNNFSLGTSLFDQTLATGVKMTANGICDITELWLA